MNITKEELAGMLHNAGLDAFSRPSDRSADSWNAYRLRIANNLLEYLPDSLGGYNPDGENKKYRKSQDVSQEMALNLPTTAPRP